MRQPFVRVTAAHPCPICGKVDKCRVSPSFEMVEVVECTRESGGAFSTRENEVGITCHYHRLRERDQGSPPSRPIPPKKPDPTTDDLDFRDAVYRRLLHRLGLSETDDEDTRRRWIDPDQTLYATLPNLGKRASLLFLLEEFGARLFSVPGFLRGHNGPRVHAGEGLLVPAQDRHGRIVALRRRDPDPNCKDNKWRYVSGGKHQDGTPGATCGTPLHWAKLPQNGSVIVSEGERKCDTISAIVPHRLPELAEAGVCSVPGVSTHRAAGLIEDLSALAVKVAYLAFDSDVWEKTQVAKALLALAADLREAGMIVNFIDWPPGAGKGLDDALLAGGTSIRVLDQKATMEHLEKLALHHGLQGKEPAEPPASGIIRIDLDQPETTQVELAFNALAEDASLFIRGGSLVTTIKDESANAGLRSAGPHVVADRLARAAFVYQARKSKTGPPVIEQKRVPTWLAERIVALAGTPGYSGRPRPISGLLHGPTINADGALVNTEGFVRLGTDGYFMTNPVPSLQISERPSLGECQAAERRIFAVVKDFPWATDLDYPKWLTLLFTAVMRPHLVATPFGLIVANAPGSGKSYLCRAIGQIAHGRDPSRINWPSDDKHRSDELNKSLTALVAGGSPLALFDNLPDGGVIDSPVLCEFITSPFFRSRKFITNDGSESGGKNRTLLLVNGNNVRAGSDLADRCLRINLECADPHPRTRPPERFGVGDLSQWLGTPANRNELLAHALTVIRGWTWAERPCPPGAYWGSYPDFVAGPVAVTRWALGADPLADRAATLEADPKASALAALMVAWDNLFATEPMPPGRILSLIENRVRDDDQDALTARESLAALGNAETSQGLGRLLQRYVGRRIPVDNKVFTIEEKKNGDTKRSEYRLSFKKIQAE